MKNLRVGRLFALGFEGLTLPRSLIEFAEKFGLGGVILFKRNCADREQIAALTGEIREKLSEADWTPLVMVDQEGGRVQRIKDGVPQLPSAWELARENLAGFKALIEAQAQALVRLGIEINLAPVCDLADKDTGGAIGDRAFGLDSAHAAKFAAAHVQACLAGGIAPCAKHFPGHGAVRGDSHEMLPRTNRSLRRFEEREFKPFESAIQAGAPLVMAAHILCPPVSPRPVSLSPQWLGRDGVLRKRMGFEGAVISDDMEMGALQALGEPAEIALQAIEAGCDLLIYGRMMRPDIDAREIAGRFLRNLSDDKEFGAKLGDRLENAIGNVGRIRKALSRVSSPDH